MLNGEDEQASAFRRLSEVQGSVLTNGLDERRVALLAGASR